MPGPRYGITYFRLCVARTCFNVDFTGSTDWRWSCDPLKCLSSILRARYFHAARRSGLFCIISGIMKYSRSFFSVRKWNLKILSEKLFCVQFFLNSVLVIRCSQTKLCIHNGCPCRDLCHAVSVLWCLSGHLNRTIVLCFSLGLPLCLSSLLQ